MIDGRDFVKLNHDDFESLDINWYSIFYNLKKREVEKRQKMKMI